LQISANVSIAALASGNVDYNLILQSVVTGNLRACRLRLREFLSNAKSCGGRQSEDRAICDLKGKKIAISSFGSATDILARLTVEHFSSIPQRCAISSLPEAARAGWRSWNRVCRCRPGFPPSDHVAESRGFKSLVRTRDIMISCERPRLHEQKLKNNRAEVKRVLARCSKPTVIFWRTKKALWRSPEMEPTPLNVAEQGVRVVVG
jgi:hypothetical protein